MTRSDKLVGFYQAYRSAIDSTEIGGRFMTYRWWSLPNRMSALWMPYSQMLGDFAPELANIINDLTHHVHRLRAWAAVLEPLDDEDKHEVAHEFVEHLGTVALGMPYAIKSRFAFAAGNLCHQANMAGDLPGWADNFPSNNLYLNDIEPFCRGWRRYRRFKVAVERIAGTAFKDASDDFRNTYNHGFSSRFVLGITASVTREQRSDGSVSYGFGGNPPLGLPAVADLLAIERDCCYAAFDAFQTLVNEQITAIVAFEAADGNQLTTAAEPAPNSSQDP